MGPFASSGGGMSEIRTALISTLLMWVAFVAGGCTTTAVPARSEADAARGPHEVVEAEAIVRALEPNRSRGLRPNAELVGESGRISLPIPFASGRADLDPATAPQLREIARALADVRLLGTRIEIAGHTDDRGDADDNRRLSERRATAVKQALDAEVDRNRVTLIARGYGETRPAPGFAPSSAEGRAASRRVELVNLGVDGAAVSSPSPLRLEVRSERKAGSRARSLQAGDELTSGSGYRLAVTPTVDCHLYVFQVDARGQLFELFPNPDYGAGTNPVAGKRVIRIPAAQIPWLVLDDTVGLETIVAIASETPLADAKQRATTLVGSGRSRGVRPGGHGSIEGTPPDAALAPVFTWSLEFQHR